MADVSCISGATLEKARKELFEVPEKRVEMISKLRESIEQWLPAANDQYEQGLVFTRKDDKFLLRFLRAKKFDVDRSLQLYVNYHKYRHKYADLVGDISVASAQEVLTSGTLCVLPPQEERPRIIVIRAGRVDFNKMKPGDMIRTMLLVLDRIIEDEATQVHGIMVLEDLNGFSLLSAMSLAGQEAVRKGIFIELIQESFPARFKGIHVVNQAWYFSLVFSIIRPFLKQKLRERFQLHGSDLQSLHRHIPIEDLPEDYGGSLPPADHFTTDKLFDELPATEP